MTRDRCLRPTVGRDRRSSSRATTQQIIIRHNRRTHDHWMSTFPPAASSADGQSTTPHREIDGTLGRSLDSNVVQASSQFSSPPVASPSTQLEINGNSLNALNSPPTLTRSTDDEHNTSSEPIFNTMSNYMRTEMPGRTESRLEPILMMDNSVISGYDHGPPNRSFPVSSHGDALSCVPQVTERRPRRGRRHRQRRRRRRRRSRHHRHRRSTRDEEPYVKPDCCSALGCKICLAGCLHFKKVLVFFATLGTICVLIGIVLGVLRAPGNSFFTLSLMFVGLGLVLLTMVLIGWKCTPVDHEPCHMLFGLGSYCSITRRDRRRRERLYWFGRRLDPEFRYRAPPPSYATAMQDYQNELLHLQSIPYVPGSPPPSYKSHTTIERPGIHIIFPRNEDFPSSNPPTYRLRNHNPRPSLAILADNLANNDSAAIPSRFSVTSTTALVDSEQPSSVDPPAATSGIVNLSFNSSDHTVDIPEEEASVAVERPRTSDGAVQTDDLFPNLPHSVAIILEDGNVSTL